MVYTKNWLNPTFSIGSYEFINNDPSAIRQYQPSKILPITLPVLLQVWKKIEKVTGYRWRNTSFIRQSYSHKLGHSIDLVPDMTPRLTAAYATSWQSDPVLYGRPQLIERLQQLVREKPPGDFTIIIAIESDHLHVQVQSAKGITPSYRIWKWAAPKHCYLDTDARYNDVQTNGQVLHTLRLNRFD